MSQSKIGTEPTMTSAELHQVVFKNTGKFEELKNFHKKVRQVLVLHEGSILELAEKLPNGQVKHYNLTEVQANMVMASIDVNHLQAVAELYVAVKNKTMSLTDQLRATADAIDYAAERARIAKETADTAVTMVTDLSTRTDDRFNTIDAHLADEKRYVAKDADEVEVAPEAGYYGIGELAKKCKGLFRVSYTPKLIHYEQQLHGEAGYLPNVRKGTAKKWVNDTIEGNLLHTYTTYNLDDFKKHLLELIRQSKPYKYNKDGTKVLTYVSPLYLSASEEYREV